MEKYILENPEVFFVELGGVHDARITNFSWDKFNKILTVGLDDLNSSFLGLTEYQGKRPVDLVFSGTSTFDMDIQLIDDQLNVYDIEVNTVIDNYMFHIKCSPGGYFKGQCEDVQIFEHENKENN